jgi:hypothetical protein
MYAVLAVIISIWLASPATAQIVNSDYMFKESGRQPYPCTTPQGESVMCNEWHFSDNGWKRFTMKPKERVLSKLVNPDGRNVNLRTPASKNVALFDALWADQRDYSVVGGTDYDAVIEELVNRPLTPAEFHQYIEVKKEGRYQFKACMVARFYEEPQEWALWPLSGIQVVLEQLGTGTPTVQAMVPNNKARFGPGMDTPGYPGDEGDYETGSVNMTWVDTLDDLPHRAERGQVFGVREYASAHVWDGLRWFTTGEAWVAGGDAEVDSYLAHAGLRTAYHEPFAPTEADAVWSCHNDFVALAPGFYRIRAIALPVFRDDFAIFHTNHDGFGSIYNILLNRTKSLPAN